MKYDTLDPLPDLNTSLDMLTTTFAPLYTECWVKEKAPFNGNPPFDMNVNVFAQMWFSKAMRIFMAYDDAGAPVGYLLGMTFRPLTHQSSIMQIEDWYARERNPVVITGLFDYVLSVLKFIGVDELWISHDERTEYPPLGSVWHRRNGTVIDRYAR